MVNVEAESAGAGNRKLTWPLFKPVSKDPILGKVKSAIGHRSIFQQNIGASHFKLSWTPFKPVSKDPILGKVKSWLLGNRVLLQ